MSATESKIKKIITAGLVIFAGLVILKYLPMQIWGKNILFDASGHLSSAIFVLYIIWFFIDQDVKWRLPYFIFCIMVLTIISLQRIIDNAHNDTGLLLGLILGITAIAIAERKNLRGKIDF